MDAANRVRIDLDGGDASSGLLLRPPSAVAAYVMAHGAGAGMTHPFIASAASGLAERGIATLRYQFPSMERGSRRPDSPAVAQAAVRAAVAAATVLLPDLPLLAGGKSFGGRMSSQAQAERPLPGVRGLVLLGFPLHPAKRPSADRARHLSDVGVPMLFLQGTRDGLADMDLLRPAIAGLGPLASLHAVAGADHGFHVTARSGRTDAEVLDELLDTAAAWIRTLVSSAR